MHQLNLIDIECCCEKYYSMTFHTYHLTYVPTLRTIKSRNCRTTQMSNLFQTNWKTVLKTMTQAHAHHIVFAERNTNAENSIVDYVKRVLADPIKHL